MCYNYYPSIWEYCKPNFNYSVWVGTGRSILYLYLIIFLSCIHIGTYLIITNNINYFFLWLLWLCFVIGDNVLTNIITPRTWKIPLAFIAVDDGARFYSINVWWYLYVFLCIRVLITGLIIVFGLYQPLTKIIIVF